MSLHQELRATTRRLNHLAEVHAHELRHQADAHAEVHLSDAIAELDAIADGIASVEDPADTERPPVHRLLGRVEGVALLRRATINGTSMLTAPDAGPTLALIVLLDDGAVGYQSPQLGRLSDEQLLAFRERVMLLEDSVNAEQRRRGGAR